MAHGAVDVYCESAADGVWTVIQKRFDGSVDFYRDWSDYKKGFGDISGEYWLGNDVIHQLSFSANYTLKIVLYDWNLVTKFAIYNTFHISDENDGYRLTVDGYSGDAGESLIYHNGQMFTTKDRDNDEAGGGNCASLGWGGAWWFKNCAISNLNGQCYSYPNVPRYSGIMWYSWHGNAYSIKKTSVMIKKWARCRQSYRLSQSE